MFKKKEINIIFKGGLGNQIFQYAFYKFLLKFYKIKFNFFFKKLEKSFLLNNKINQRQYCLDKYLKKKVSKIKLKNNENVFLSRSEKIISYLLKKNIFLPLNTYDGYWQDNFFAENVSHHDFDPSVLQRPQKLPCNYYILHYRGGDFFNSKSHHVLSFKYYIFNIKKFNDLPIFAISDDLFNLRKILKKINLKINIYQCNEKDAFRAIYNAKGGIASNSTFAWWPIYISKNNNWIFPLQWLKNKNIYQSNLFIPGTQVSNIN